MTAPYDPPMPPPVHDVDPATVRSWLESGEAVLVDVREPDEHARERIDGTTLVPLSRFDAEQLGAETGRRLVLHCRSGMRSKDACRRALASGALEAEIYNLAGGIEAWKRAGLPVERTCAAPRLGVLRQVQLVIGLGVVTGSVLAVLVSPWFAGLSIFFGAGLLLAGTTGHCPLASMLANMPWNRG